MIKIILVVIFILGALFSNASQIPAWLLGAGKPNDKETPHWKVYGVIAAFLWVGLFAIANLAL